MNFLSTQNVNVARFARNVEWDFFCDFQTLWCEVKRQSEKVGKKGVMLNNETWSAAVNHAHFTTEIKRSEVNVVFSSFP